MTNIQWTQPPGYKGETWNPVIGCSKVSAGCDNCYAMKQAGRIVHMHGPTSSYAGTTKEINGRQQWSGLVKTLPERLDQPLRWRNPRCIFVNSMSDLFHEDVPDEFIAAVFGVMAASPRHIFQVLTKRPQRMREWFELMADEGNPTRVEHCEIRAGGLALARHMKEQTPDAVHGAMRCPGAWPLPNVWLGVSAEDQETFDARTASLLQTPAAVRFVSCEPLLGPIDMCNVPWGPNRSPILDTLRAGRLSETPWHLKWVIVGGESGAGARWCDIADVRHIVRQCAEADVPCFVKQLGSKPFERHDQAPVREIWSHIKHSKGGDPEEWPEDLRIREWPRILEATT